MIPKILIVDDLALNVRALEHVLRAEGFQTCSAVDGAGCLQSSRMEHPDLILLDVMMPGLTGFETCAHLKTDLETADIPIIFVSALDDVKNKVKGLKIGGVDFISKPIHGEEVLARVRVHLRIQESNRARAREQRARIEELRYAQKSILISPADCPEACFAVCYEPLEGAGGDFFDVVKVDAEVFTYFVADISGHGVKAAFLTSSVKALLRQFVGPLFSPEDTMKGVNSVMRQILGEEEYLTACLARLNRRTGILSVVSAGHPPLVVVSASGAAQTIELDGEPLGMFNTLAIQRKDVRVHPGDRLFLYTDGITESVAGGSRTEGLAKLIDSCIRNRAQPLADTVSTVMADLMRGKCATDDLLLLATEVTG